MSIIAKKSVARIQEESNAHALKRTLGKWNLLSLGIGCIIGAGIFVMTGTAAAQHAGPAIIFSFILAGLACADGRLARADGRVLAVPAAVAGDSTRGSPACSEGLSLSSESLMLARAFRL